MRAWSMLIWLLVAGCARTAGPDVSSRDSSGNETDRPEAPPVPVPVTDTEQAGAARAGQQAMSAQERVKRAAPDEATVTPWQRVQVPGMALFWVNLSGPDDDDSGYGVVVREDELLRGEAAMSAASAAGVSAPGELAELAAMLLVSRGKPLQAAEDERHRRAGVSAPAAGGGVLTYWWDDYGVSSRTLMRTEVTLSSWQVASEEREPGAGGPADAVTRAAAMLAGASVAMHRGAIDILAARCGDAGAVAALAGAAREHGVAATRRLAVEALGKCGARADVAALIDALGDADAGVRWRAAAALGQAGDDKAVGALQKATQDADSNVRYAAEKALEALR